MDSSFISNRNIPYSLESLGVFSCLLEREFFKKGKKRLGYMQIILSVAKCIKSSRVFSMLPSCEWRTNNHWQPESPSGKMDRANGTKSLFAPKKKPSWSHCWELLRGRAWGTERLPLPLGTRRRGSFSHFSCPPPGLGSSEILVPRSQSADSSTAALG